MPFTTNKPLPRTALEPVCEASVFTLTELLVVIAIIGIACILTIQMMLRPQLERLGQKTFLLHIQVTRN